MRLSSATFAVVWLLPVLAAAASWQALNPPASTVYDQTFGTGISADGGVVVGYAKNSSSGVTQAFRWTASGGLVLLSTTSTDGVVFSTTTACCVSADGSMVAGSGTTAAGSTATPLSWSISTSGSNTLTAVPSSFAANQVRALSPDGTVSGGTGTKPATTGSCAAAVSLPALWPSPGPSWDGAAPLPGTNSGDVYAIATAGILVVGDVYDECAGGAAPMQAFAWSPATGFTLLGAPSGATFGVATAMSSDGKLIAGYAGTSATFQAVLWTLSAGVTGLSAGAAATGQEVGFIPSGVSADGTVIVGNNATNSNPRGSSSPPELWTAATGAVDLFDVLLDNGLFTPPAFEVLSNAAGISGDGNWVVGTAVPWPVSGAPVLASVAFVSYIGLSPPAPANLQVVASPTGAISLSWRPVADITDYMVYLNGNLWLLTTATTATISGLNAGQTYDVSVGTESPQGQSPPSAAVSIAVTPGNGQINVTWTPVQGATEYVVGISTTPGGESPATSSCPSMCGTVFAAGARTGTLGNLHGGQTYYVKVFAKAAVGNPVSSAEASATPLATASNGGSGGSASMGGSGAPTTNGAGGGGALELVSLLTLGALLWSCRASARARACATSALVVGADGLEPPTFAL
jgi:probable HAF family extracellular repeat protein